MTLKNFATTLLTPSWKQSLYFRRALALLLLIVAALTGWIQALDRDPSCVVLTRDVQPGTTLTASDIELRPIPAAARPSDSVVLLSDATDRTAATVLRAGDVLTSRHLMGHDLADALTPGMLADEPLALVPVKLADPSSASLIYPGVLVTIVTASNEDREPTVVATGARVIFATAAETSKLSAGTVLVALPQSAGHAVAAASLQNPLTVVVGNDSDPAHKTT